MYKIIKQNQKGKEENKKRKQAEKNKTVDSCATI